MLLWGIGSGRVRFQGGSCDPDVERTEAFLGWGFSWRLQRWATPFWKGDAGYTGFGPIIKHVVGYVVVDRFVFQRRCHNGHSDCNPNFLRRERLSFVRHRLVAHVKDLCQKANQRIQAIASKFLSVNSHKLEHGKLDQAFSSCQQKFPDGVIVVGCRRWVKLDSVNQHSRTQQLLWCLGRHHYVSWARRCSISVSDLARM